MKVKRSLGSRRLGSIGCGMQELGNCDGLEKIILQSVQILCMFFRRFLHNRNRWNFATADLLRSLNKGFTPKSSGKRNLRRSPMLAGIRRYAPLQPLTAEEFDARFREGEGPHPQPVSCAFSSFLKVTPDPWQEARSLKLTADGRLATAWASASGIWRWCNRARCRATRPTGSGRSR